MGPWEREVFSPAVWIKPHVERDERHASEKLVGCAIRRTWALLPGWNSRRVNEMTEIIRQYGVRRWRGPERASLTSCANAVTKKKKALILIWRTWTRGILEDGAESWLIMDNWCENSINGRHMTMLAMGSPCL